MYLSRLNGSKKVLSLLSMSVAVGPRKLGSRRGWSDTADTRTVVAHGCTFTYALIRVLCVTTVDVACRTTVPDREMSYFIQFPGNTLPCRLFMLLKSFCLVSLRLLSVKWVCTLAEEVVEWVLSRTKIWSPGEGPVSETRTPYT